MMIDVEKKDPSLLNGEARRDWNRERDELLRLLPPVLRARDFRLYTQGGTRLVDLWQYGGAAVLGHTPAGTLRALKNSAERGLFTPLPHPLENRLLKALSRLLPDRVFGLYADETSLREALKQGGVALFGDSSFPDPALPPSDKTPSKDAPVPVLSLWRPFLSKAGVRLSPVLIPVLPWALAPWVLAVEKDFAASRRFPPSDILSPVLLAAAARTVWDLIAAVPERERKSFPKIEKALSQGGWTRQGVYLYPLKNPGREVWAVMFRRFLDEGFLFPPCPRLPVILPGSLSPGEEARLAKLLREIPSVIFPG
jgi:hypothetical protein